MKRKKPQLVRIEGQKNATFLSPELINQVEQLYRVGLKDSAVANIIGISSDILSEWLLRGAAHNNGLYGELFKRCAKAVSSGELEFVAKIRECALGKAAEYAYREITKPDGSVVKELQLDGEGKAIVLREEIKPNPVWASWFLERRFSKHWSKQDAIGIVLSTPESASNNAMRANDAGEQEKIIKQTIKEAWKKIREDV